MAQTVWSTPVWRWFVPFCPSLAATVSLPSTPLSGYFRLQQCRFATTEEDICHFSYILERTLEFARTLVREVREVNLSAAHRTE